jgi:hypothetical protein
MERAGAHGLPVSKPWGEMSSYDFVIGKTGRFISVQVKSTLSRLETGYVCTVRGGHKAYVAGSFDFLAAYVIPDDPGTSFPPNGSKEKEWSRYIRTHRRRSTKSIARRGICCGMLLGAFVFRRYRGFPPASSGITTPWRSSSQAMADIFHSASFRTN